MTYCKHCSIDSATVSWQARRIAELEEEVKTLRTCITGANWKHEVKPGGAHKLTPAQAAILSLLLTQERVSNDAIYHCYKRRTPFDCAPDRNLIKVQIHHIRQKLKPLGLRIETLYGYGYQMMREDRDKAFAEFVEPKAA